MRRSLYASSAIHAGLLGWVVFGGLLFDRSPEVEFEVTGVTIMSTAEFEALTAVVAAPAVPEAPTAPALPEVADAPVAPTVEAPPPATDAPVETAAPPPESTPVPVDPIPQTEVTDEVAVLAPPPGAPDADISPTPTPDDAPRVAPVAAPLPEPDVETAPEVLEQTTEPEVAEDTPTEETPDTAPEEATTEIVTEAEEPAAAPLGPTASVRPTPRPSRPAPVEEPAEDAPADVAEVDPDPEPSVEQPDIASGVNAALEQALAEDAAPAPATPSGPPLSQGVRDGFRVAVQACWNVGALSTEALGTTVVVAFDMGRNGVPEAGTMRMIEFSGGSESAALQAYEAARRAIIRCGANGYDLPEESYDRWHQVELVFNPEGMRLR